MLTNCLRAIFYVICIKFLEMDPAFARVQARYRGLSDVELKEEQRVVVERILDGQNCVVQLPTGFGKSLLYTIPPLIMDEKEPEIQHTAIVISPLRSLIEDQVSQLKEKGVSVAAVTMDLSKAESKAIMSNPPSVLLASPEAIVRPIYRGLVSAPGTCLLVLDEAHCASEWGLDFRKEYRRVGELVSATSCPTVCMSATLTDDIAKDIKALMALDLETTFVLAKQPDRPNIMLLRSLDGGNLDQLAWLLDLIREKGVDCPKTIVFSSSVNAVARIYRYLMSELSVEAYVDKSKMLKNRMVDMYHSHSDENSRVRVQQVFTRPDSHIRVVAATVALGLGVNIPDVRIVIHWGVPDSVMVYWQEVGRAGRDGKPALAIAHSKARDSCKGKVVDAMESTTCIRKEILGHFLGACAEVVRECGCSCCSNCALQCPCQAHKGIRELACNL